MFTTLKVSILLSMYLYAMCNSIYHCSKVIIFHCLIKTTVPPQAIICVRIIQGLNEKLLKIRIEPR